MKKDCYQVLQVHPKASPAVIEAAYRALMKEHHPDLDHATVGTHAKDLNEAHDILTDPRKRKDFDRERIESSTKMIGPYKVQSVIAEGGFGRKHKAHFRTPPTRKEKRKLEEYHLCQSCYDSEDFK